MSQEYVPALRRDEWGRVRWYVMRAYKQEGAAERALLEAEQTGEDTTDLAGAAGQEVPLRGMEHFIPKRYAVRTYHGQKRRELVPVIPSLVFVRASRLQISAFKQRCPLLHYATWKREGMLPFITVDDAEMENFIRVASHYDQDLTFYQPEELQLTRGQRVRVLGGPFSGVTGTFVKLRGRRARQLVVQLDGLVAASVSVTPELIELL